MSYNINKRIYGGPINKKIHKKLVARQLLANPNDSSRTQGGFPNPSGQTNSNYLEALGDIANSNFKGVQELSSKTPWVRLWCAIEQYEVDIPNPNVDDEGNPIPSTKGKILNTKIYTIGNHSFNDYKNPTDSMTNSQEDGSQGAETLAKEFIPDELNSNILMRPGAGITSVSVENSGRIMGSLRKAKIQFTVHNFKDFEDIYLRYFMKPGALLVLDFGWDTADISSYNPEELIKNNPKDFEDKIFGEDGFIKKAEGDLDCVVGVVGKFNSTTRADGGFDCTVELTSKNMMLMNETIGGTSGKGYTKFINKLGTWAIMQVADVDPKIWDMDWINTKSADDLAAIYGLRDLGNTSYQIIAGRKIPLVQLNTRALETGVYYQWIDSGAVDPKIKNNVFISFKFLEKMLLNPLLGSKDIGMVRDKNTDDTNAFDQSFNSELSVVGLNSDLWKMMQITGNKESLKFVYGYPADIPNPAAPDGKLIRLWDIFINTNIIIDAIKSNHYADEVIKSILGEINAASMGTLSLVLVSGNYSHTELAIVDENTIPLGYKIVDLEGDAEERSLDFNNLFTFFPHSPNTIVQDFQMNYNVGSGKMATMVALSNDLVDRKFPFNDKMRDSIKSSNVLNSEGLLKQNYGYTYLPNSGKLPGIIETHQEDFDTYDYRDEIPPALMSKKPELDNSVQSYKDKLEIQSVFQTETIDKSEIDDLSKMDKEFEEIKKEETEFNKKISEQAEESDWAKQAKTPGAKYAKNLAQYYEFYIKKDLDNPEKNPNYHPPILGMELSLSIKGIAGLSIGDAFKISYMPTEYRNIMYFVIKNLSHEVNKSGWTVKITGQYRPHFKLSTEIKEVTTKDVESIKIRLSKTYLKGLGYSHEQIAVYDTDYMDDTEGFLKLQPLNYVSKDKAGTLGVSSDNATDQSNSDTINFNAYADIDPELLKDWKRVQEEQAEGGMSTNPEIAEFNAKYADKNGQIATYMPEDDESRAKACEELAKMNKFESCGAMKDWYKAKFGVDMNI